MSLTDHQRTEAVVHANFLHAYQAHVNWSEIRPIPNMDQSQVGMQRLFDDGYIWPTDCAGVIQWVFRWIGAKSPTGLPFNEGGTSAMYAHLPRFTEQSAIRMATIGVYGVDGDAHGVLVTEPGPTRETTKVLSHGRPYNCNILTLAEEDAAHVGLPFTYLAVGGL